MVRRILAAVAVALLCFALPAFATVRDALVKIRVPDAPYDLVRPGQPWSGDIVVTARPGADIADFEFAGDGWTVAPLRTGDQRALLATGQPVTFRLQVLRANPERPLTVLYSSGGKSYEQRLSLRELTHERVRTRPLRPVTEAEAATRAMVPNAAALERAPMPFRRVSRDAEGVVRGAVGDSVIGDAERRARLDASGARSTTARDIRVRGSIVGQGPLGTFGADGVYFAVYDEDTGVDALLAEGTTDANGNYDVTFSWDPCFLCDSQPDLYVYFETENAHIVSQSPSLEWEYSWETGVVPDYTGTNYNFGAFMPGDMTSDGVLYTHTTLTRVWRWFNSRGWNVPSVDVQCWDTDADPVSYYSPLGEIHMSPARMFFTPSMAHEYHHHWMSEYSSDPSPSYCNGNCDANGDCGHCQWCQENGSIVWTEGVPEFGERLVYNMLIAQFPGFTNSLRDVEQIDSCTTAVDDGNKTEGLFAAAMYDLVDSNNENDLVVPGLSTDVLTLDDKLPYQIFDEVAPSTVAAFFNEVSSRNPGQKKNIWSTAMNGGVNLDLTAPGVVTGLTSTDHTINVLSGDASIAMKWNEAPDDWSGAGGYSVSFVSSPALPDTFSETSALSLTSGFLNPGTYYVCVRARDRFGRWSASYASAGPYLLRTPDPADLHSIQPAGWARPVVPADLSNNSAVSVPAPTALFGTGGVTYWNAAGTNTGSDVTGTFDLVLLVDGDSADVSTATNVFPGNTFTSINQSGVFMRGGRHTFGVYYDGGEDIPETNETNNQWARQWSWSSTNFNSGTIWDAGAAPYRVAGHSAIPSGESVYMNSYGITGRTSTTQWTAFWAHAMDSEDDSDVRLHFDTTNPDTGFTRTVAVSQRLGGFLDATLFNKTASQFPWDHAVVNWNGGSSNFHFKLVTSTTFNFGDSVAVGFAAYDMMTMHSVSVPLASLGDVVVTLRAAPGDVVHLLWLDDSYTYGTISNYTASAVTDSNGLARILINVNAAANYGVVCYRDPKDGTGALPFTLQIERAPADLAAVTPAGWYSPVVPRAALDVTMASVPMPDTLKSTPSPTYFNMGAKNIGTIAAPPTSSWMLVDGALAATYGYPTWNAGASMNFISTYAVYIRGGRHTLSHILDGDDLVEELVTNNNQYGEQYVWGPLALANDVTTSRLAPPDRTAGWSEVTNAATLFFNSDGVRTPNLPPSGTSHLWSAVAVMPGASSDVDLRVHELAPGTKEGFKNPIAYSVWTAGLSDFVLADFNVTPFRQFDVGAIRYSGTENYWVMPTTSQRRTLPTSGVIGDFSQGTTDLLDLHEVWLWPGNWTVTLKPLSGAANLGLSAHAPAAVQGKGNSVATAWLQPAGADEILSFTVPTAGFYCLAVWKTGTADVGQSATYRLIAANGALGVEPPLPTRTAFAKPWPNPAAGATRLSFALPAESFVTLELYDVSGARVRTLASGTYAAGEHGVTWDGRTDAGDRAPAGLYYARFAGGGLHETRKIVRVE
ncbi:MAG: CARDB domain-containing protein [Candidatus Eisenbacteria bacterium]